MNKEALYKTQVQKLKGLSSKEFETIRLMCGRSKNLYNVTLYSIRQYYFQEKKFLRYESNYHYVKENENYSILNTGVSQQVMKVVDRNFRGFFNATKEYYKKPDKFTGKPKLPKYLPKDGLFNLIFNQVTIKDGYFYLPMSPGFKKENGKIKIKFPGNINPDQIVEIRINPKNNGKYFQMEYIYKVKESVKLKTTENNTLAIDLGVNNLVSCITNTGTALLISGKSIKSINQWYNKKRSKLSSIKDKQGYSHETNQMFTITQKRNLQINDYINKSAKSIIDFSLFNNISNLVVGYNNFWKQDINIGKKNNQKFVMIPHGKLRDRLKLLSENHGINFIEQEESYTSKSSFIDKDEIPVFKFNTKSEVTFSGRRIKRGLYKTKDGLLVNSDLNGASNILRKSKQNFDYEKLCSGLLTKPLRIRVSNY